MRAQSDYIGRWCVCVQSHAEWIEFGMGEDLYGRGGFMLSMGELYVPGVIGCSFQVDIQPFTFEPT